jgi:hypothetical protein
VFWHPKGVVSHPGSGKDLVLALDYHGSSWGFSQSIQLGWASYRNCVLLLTQWTPLAVHCAQTTLAAYMLQCRTQLDPAPLVVIASSDSDMQQLLDEHTYWLELQQVSAGAQGWLGWGGVHGSRWPGWGYDERVGWGQLHIASKPVLVDSMNVGQLTTTW